MTATLPATDVKPTQSVVDAVLPADLIYIAAQFASDNPYKQVLNTISVEKIDGQLVICSTDGTRMFRVKVDLALNEKFSYEGPQVLLGAAVFKKRIAGSFSIRIFDLLGDKTAWIHSASGKRLCAFDYEHDYGSSTYPNYNQLIPEAYSNQPDMPIFLNSKLLADFLAQVTKYGNSLVKMQTNSPHNPLMFTAEHATYNNVTMEFLLMPIRPTRPF